jgi:hypothetical protein
VSSVEGSTFNVGEISETQINSKNKHNIVNTILAILMQTNGILKTYQT